jgi:phosphatidylglycerophosphatase A
MGRFVQHTSPPDRAVGRNLRARVAFWIAVSGGPGLFPYWPGTAGAILGVIIAFALTFTDTPLTAAVLVGLFAAGAWAAFVVETEWRVDDPQFVSVDETFGAAATLCLLPAEPAWWAAGFLAFRILDVAKPWPASLVHRKMRGGLAIMLDDAIAAAMAAALLLAARAAFTSLL